MQNINGLAELPLAQMCAYGTVTRLFKIFVWAALDYFDCSNGSQIRHMVGTGLKLMVDVISCSSCFFYFLTVHLALRVEYRTKMHIKNLYPNFLDKMPKTDIHI